MKLLCTLLIMLTILVAGCSTVEEPKQLCNAPYIEFMAGECCLDADNNSICDSDETVVETTENSTPKEDPEIVAVKFANALEKGDYSYVYSRLNPRLKNKRSESEFDSVMSYVASFEPAAMRLDDVKVISENEAYAYYTISSGIVKTETPTIEMVYFNDKWVFSLFSLYFDDERIMKEVCDKNKDNVCMKTMHTITNNSIFCVRWLATTIDVAEEISCLKSHGVNRDKTEINRECSKLNVFDRKECRITFGIQPGGDILPFITNCESPHDFVCHNINKFCVPVDCKDGVENIRPENRVCFDRGYYKSDYYDTFQGLGYKLDRECN
jgi:hypothetical protein